MNIDFSDETSKLSRINQSTLDRLKMFKIEKGSMVIDDNGDYHTVVKIIVELKISGVECHLCCVPRDKDGYMTADMIKLKPENIKTALRAMK